MIAGKVRQNKESGKKLIENLSIIIQISKKNIGKLFVKLSYLVKARYSAGI